MDFNFDWTKYRDNTGTPLAGMPSRLGVGANAIIFDDDGYILLEKRSDNGWWGLPGGHVEIGESAQDAVVREVLEETGLVVEIMRLVGVYSHPDNLCFVQYPDGNTAHILSIVFECTATGGTLQMSDESTELRYNQVNSLPDQVVLSHKIRIEDALLRSPIPFVK